MQKIITFIKIQIKCFTRARCVFEIFRDNYNLPLQYIVRKAIAKFILGTLMRILLALNVSK